MMTTPDYLGVLDGEHVWSDGLRLPVLMGFDDPDPDDPPEPDEPDEGDEPGDEVIDPQDQKPEGEPLKNKRRNNHPRPERQAAAYRVQRNEARRERDALTEQRDALRLEMAFVRAAGGRFVDLDAAWELADRSILTIDIDGTPVGAEETVDALAEANPFLLAADDEEPKDRDPFKETRSSGAR